MIDIDTLKEKIHFLFVLLNNKSETAATVEYNICTHIDTLWQELQQANERISELENKPTYPFNEAFNRNLQEKNQKILKCIGDIEEFCISNQENHDCYETVFKTILKMTREVKK